MNTDSYYEIGYNHTVCEDYALAGKINDKISYAIVSDGCSSSPFVDVGARLLAHSARKFLVESYGFYKELPSITAYGLGLSIVIDAHRIQRNLGLPLQALDCTLLIALSDGEFTQCFMYGDGGIIAKRKNVEDIGYTTTEFPSGAPFYLSYLLSDKRLNDYKKSFDQHAIVRHDNINGGRIDDTSQIKDFHDFDMDVYNHCTLAATNYEMVALVSDGINTYDKQNGRFKIKVGTCDMIERYISYKNFHGQFVERKMKRVKKDCKKNNISHFDDISVATIYIGG